MIFVHAGSRQKTTSFLWYSTIIAIFGLMMGGGLISKDYESGTVRMLFIRPKKRYKIILARLFALLIICMSLYALTSLINMIIYGIHLGFTDFANPIYSTISDQGTNFFVDYIGKFLCCCLQLIFTCTLSSFLSCSTKNTAVSVGLTIGLIIISIVISTSIFNTGSNAQWLLYTPIPYINMWLIFTQHLTPYIPPLIIGSTIMLFTATILTCGSALVTQTKDI